jgi:hypothetical protein
MRSDTSSTSNASASTPSKLSSGWDGQTRESSDDSSTTPRSSFKCPPPISYYQPSAPNTSLGQLPENRKRPPTSAASATSSHWLSSTVQPSSTKVSNTPTTRRPNNPMMQGFPHYKRLLAQEKEEQRRQEQQEKSYRSSRNSGSNSDSDSDSATPSSESSRDSVLITKQADESESRQRHSKRGMRETITSDGGDSTFVGGTRGDADLVLGVRAQ